MLASELEPVKPNPKVLRRTALTLVAIMIVGGVLILRAYQKNTEESEKDNRPSLMAKISETKDLNFLRQDGEVSDLMKLKGKVVIVQSLAQSQPDEQTTGVMKRLSEKYAANDDVVLVTLMLDPGSADSLKEELKKLAGVLGAELPKWTVASNDQPTLHRFIKNEFKATMMPHEEKRRWIYDESLVLIDRERRVRRAVIPQKRGGASHVQGFDFQQAAEWDAKGIKTGIERTNVEQLEFLLQDTIEILLNEKE